MIDQDKMTTDLCPASVWHQPLWCRWPREPRCTCCGCGSWVAKPDSGWRRRSSSAAPVLSVPPPTEWPEDFSEQTEQYWVFTSVESYKYIACVFSQQVYYTTHKFGVLYLSEAGHGFTRDDLIAVEAWNETQGLVLVLPSFQLAQDQCPEYLDILQDTRDDRWVAERINRQFPEDIEVVL